MNGAGTLVLDHSALHRLAEPTSWSLALLRRLLAAGLWPPIVPSLAMAEALSGDEGRDTAVRALLDCCWISEDVPAARAQRAAWLRTAAGRGSALDALVVASAEPGGAVLIAGRRDAVEAMALFADQVFVERI